MSITHGNRLLHIYKETVLWSLVCSCSIFHHCWEGLWYYSLLLMPLELGLQVCTTTPHVGNASNMTYQCIKLFLD